MGRHFLWDPIEDNIVKEIDDSGNTTADYTTEPFRHGDVISQHRDGESSFYHFDGQGNTTSLTDTDGNVTDTYAYNAFGEVTQRTGDTVNPFQFVGQHAYYTNGVTGTLMVRQNTLWTEKGRWLSVDTGIFGASYAYVHNNPCLFIDPSGLIKVLAVTATPLEKQGCGKNHSVQWLFTLDKKAPCNGFIIQNVLSACRVESDCPLGCPLPEGAELSVVTFWEAWRVKEGESSPAEPAFHTDAPNDTADDLRCGEVLSVGIVRFFCERDYNGTLGTGNLDELWKPVGKVYGKPPCEVFARSLPSRGLPIPSWWLTPAVEGPAFTWFSLKWDCCPCHRTFVEFNPNPG